MDLLCPSLRDTWLFSKAMENIEQGNATGAAGNGEFAFVLWVKVKIEDCIWER